MKKLLLLVFAGLVFAALASTAFAAYSGACGDNATWNLDDDGLLTIEGEGAVTNAEWRTKGRDSIRSVVIPEASLRCVTMPSALRKTLKQSSCPTAWRASAKGPSITASAWKACGCRPD